MAHQSKCLTGARLGFFGVAAVILAGTAWNGRGGRAGGSTDDLHQDSHRGVVVSPTRQNPIENEEGLIVPSAEEEQASPDGVDPDWWGRVQADIAQSEYHISWQNGVGAYQSPNRAQNLRFTYRGDGFSAEPRTHEEPTAPWKLDMRLSAWGREDKRMPYHAGELETTGNRAVAEGPGISILYENKREGMRQDFLVRERPAGQGPLRLWLDLDLDGVVAEVEQDGCGLSFGRAISGGTRVMSYGNLEVRDAQGRQLEAEIVRQDEDHFAITVDDAEAVYPILVDPLSSSPDWTAESNQADAKFGNSVAGAGDVNGDGYSDVIVGAYSYDNGEADEGRAYVYHGSTTGLSISPDWVAESNQAGAGFGWSVAGAGDVNGDGYSDAIVGAFYYDNGQTNEGRAFVFHGSATGLNASANWIAESNQADAKFGNSVAGAGDVNGDGYSDVIVGVYWWDNGQTNEGRASVYHGSASGLSTSADWTAEGNQDGAIFGVSVAGAGDVNGDGYSDVIVGAENYDNGETDEGRAYVYHGSATGLNTSANWIAESNQADALFGGSVAGAGDVNGDGYSDVIVGARWYDNGETDEGRASVYHGSATGLNTSADWTAQSNQANAYFGSSVAMAGDVNGDGYSDVIVGASLYDNGEADEGRASVYHGSSTGLNTNIYADWTAESDQAGAYFGNAVATAGDVNGDGYSDVIVAAHYYDNGEENEGRACVYHGNPSGLSPSVWGADSDQVGASFGNSVAGAGDVNGDGYSDVIVGAHYYDNGEENEGRAFVYHGNSTGLSLSPNWYAESDQLGAQLGISVAGAGDVNGDGYSDVIIGAYFYDNDEINEGRVYLYHGGPAGLNTSPDWTAESNQDSASLGISVAGAGDVNGDGYSDVIIGAYYFDNDETNEGRAYLYHGSSAGLTTSPDWTAESNQAGARFGNSVATAGDVNGDGYSDVIVGAYYYDNGEMDEGRACVYHGSSTGLSTAAEWSVESNQADAWFGISVAGAGDVNGDGYSDVVVGASQYDNGEFNEGRTYVYHGGSTGLNTSPDWTAEANYFGAHFGGSVATAGDVNGDGYSDIIVGAYLYGIDPPAGEGRAYVYHGSSTGLNTSPDWTGRGYQEGAHFGNSVATAGDVNGDGYSDIIVGAKDADTGEYLEGRAFVCYGNDSDGLSVLPRQWRANLATPVVPALKTRSQSQVGLGFFARTFFGRNDLGVQFEVKPLGTPFDGTGLVTTDWLDPGTTGASVSEIIGGLSDRTMYKWRTRVKYCLSDGAPQPYGRWIYQPYNGGLGEADFQVNDDDLPPPPDPPVLLITRLSATVCCLWWGTTAGATSYDLYRGTSAIFVPGTSWHTVAAPDTFCFFTEGVGDPATNYYFLCRAVGVWGESEDSNRVGEFDLDTAGLTSGTDETRGEIR